MAARNPRISHGLQLARRDQLQSRQDPPPNHLWPDLEETTVNFWEHHNRWRPILILEDGNLDFDTARLADRNRRNRRVRIQRKQRIVDSFVVSDGTPYLQVYDRERDIARWYDLEELLFQEPAKVFFYVMEHSLLYEDIAWFKALPGSSYVFREGEDVDTGPEDEDFPFESLRTTRRQRTGDVAETNGIRLRRLRRTVRRRERRRRNERDRARIPSPGGVARMPPPVARRSGPPSRRPPVEDEIIEILSSDSE